MVHGYPVPFLTYLCLESLVRENRICCLAGFYFFSVAVISTEKCLKVSLSCEVLILGLSREAQLAQKLVADPVSTKTRYSDFLLTGFSTNSIPNCLGHREPPDLENKM